MDALAKKREREIEDTVSRRKMMKNIEQGEEKYVENLTRRKLMNYRQEIEGCKDGSGRKANECAEKKE